MITFYIQQWKSVVFVDENRSIDEWRGGTIPSFIFERHIPLTKEVL